MRARFPYVLPIALLPVLALACAPDSESDLVPPRVVGVDPPGLVIAVDTTFRVRFSEALNAKTVVGDPTQERFSVGLILAEDASDSFVSDVDKNSTVLSETGQAKIIAADVSLLDNGEVIELAPRASLAPSTGYTLVIASEVRDVAGNPIVNGAGAKELFRWDVTTDPGPPSVVSTDLVSASASLVAPNRKRIHVTFNTAVNGVSADSLRIEGGNPAPTIEAVTLNETRTIAELVLAPADAPADDGCERLTPAHGYSLVASSAIEDDAGRALQDFKEDFLTGPSCDLAPNEMSGPPDSIAGETDATIRFDTNKASTTEVRFGVSGGALDCLGQPCPILGAAARNPVAGATPVRFAHSVQLTGLTLGVQYDVIASAEDDVGNVATRPSTFLTEAVPEVALNEVISNPPTREPPDSSESVGEYIELASFSDLDLPIGLYQLLVDGGEDAGGDTCILPVEVVLPAHGFLLLVGTAFDPALYGNLTEELLVRGTAASFCGSITNSRAQTFLLADPTGRPVSSMTAYGDVPSLGVEAVSVERKSPELPDVAANWCRSLAGVGPTPGRENGVTINGCAP